MSVWTEIEGTVSIYKKDRISIQRVAEDMLTDECTVKHSVEVKEDHYRYKLVITCSLDGDEFVKRYEKFLEALKPIHGSLDLTATIRLLR